MSLVKFIQNPRFAKVASPSAIFINPVFVTAVRRDPNYKDKVEVYTTTTSWTVRGTVEEVAAALNKELESMEPDG